MVSNAQLHNEKSNLMYQVDTLKEALIELEEQLWEARRERDDRAKVRSHMIVREFTAKPQGFLAECVDWI